MKRNRPTILSIWLGIVLGLLPAFAPMTVAAAPSEGGPTNAPARLRAVLDDAVRGTVTKFAEQKLQPDQLAATLVDLRDPARPVTASHRGDAQIYPASVVKLFYLVAAHRWLETGKLKGNPELARALHDMIVDSYNEATHYVVDVLTDTTSGPELSTQDLQAWADKRNAVNRYFVSLGYSHINVNKKPWCEGPYGREVQAARAFQPSRNLLTTDATARLLSEIATGRAVSAKRSGDMMALLKRDPSGKSADPDDQAHGFSGGALAPGWKLWSKAGWTSEVRHDAAYLEGPDGARLVLVIFTVGHANERDIIPHFVRAVLEGLGVEKAKPK